MAIKDSMNNVMENVKSDIVALGFDVEGDKIYFNRCIEASLCEANENGCVFEGWFSIFGKKFENKKFFYSYKLKNMSLFSRESLDFDIFDITKNVDIMAMAAIGFPFKNWLVKDRILTINFRQRNSVFRLNADSGVYVFNEILKACEEAEASANWVDNLKDFHTKVEIVDSVFNVDASRREGEHDWEGFSTLTIFDAKNLICAYLKYIIENKKDEWVLKELSKINFKSFDEMYKDILYDNSMIKLPYIFVNSFVSRWQALPCDDVSIFKSSDMKISLCYLHNFISDHKIVMNKKNIGDYSATDRTNCYEERSYIEV